MRKLVEQYLFEGFMKPVVMPFTGAIVDTRQGTSVVVDDVWSGPDYTNDADIIAEHFDSISDYLEVSKPEDVLEVDKFSGWAGRLAASGYMDATDWTWGKTKNEVIKDLQRTYADEDEDLYNELERMKD